MKEELLTVGQKLANYRKENNLTLQDVGEALGLTRSHVCKLENGAASPSFSTLIKLAEMIGVPLFELFAPTNGLNPLTCARIIRERLAEMHWTLEELQELTQIDYIRLIRIAEGEVTPTADEWQLIIQGLGMPSQNSINMVFNLMKTFLEGSGMPEEQVKELLKHISETLK